MYVPEYFLHFPVRVFCIGKEASSLFNPLSAPRGPSGIHFWLVIVIARKSVVGPLPHVADHVEHFEIVVCFQLVHAAGLRQATIIFLQIHSKIISSFCTLCLQEGPYKTWQSFGFL